VTGPLAGRVAVVTGGSSGIGAAVVRMLRDLDAATAAIA
jgi:NAD(P)-dependent dehydrogenase (short-subunit alcohol dehydrogenase family)